MSIAKWGTETTTKFIQAYEQQEVLWDHNHPYYKNKSIRNGALHEIVTKMGLLNFSAREAKSKIHALRATYISERKRIRDSMIAAREGLTEKVYYPKLAWYPMADSFLRRVVTIQLQNAVTKEHKEQNLSMIIKKDYPDSLEEQEEEEDEFSEIEIINGENIKSHDETVYEETFILGPDPGEDDSQHAIDQPTQPEQVIIDNHQYTSISSSQLQHDDNSQHFEIAKVSTIDTVENYSCSFKRKRSLNGSTMNPSKKLSSKSSDSEDEFDVFGSSIAIQVRNLPRREAYELQSKIQELVSATKIRALGRMDGKNASNTSGFD